MLELPNCVHRTHANLFSESGAIFSRDGFYRYLLYRRWSDGPIANWLLLNPSTATEQVNDPTIARLERRCKQLAYGQLWVTNIFAYRATDPRTMMEADDPVGPENNKVIRYAAEKASKIICAWGTHGWFAGRAEKVCEILREFPLYMLKLCADGQPSHPLYLGYDLTPSLWKEPTNVPSSIPG